MRISKRKIIGVLLVAVMAYGVINELSTAKTVVPKVSTIGKAKTFMDKDMMIRESKAIRPLRALGGRRYCSSSVMNHRGERYTVTNRHCCAADLKDGMAKGYRQVGDTLEKIIFISQASDICILKTQHRYGLKVSKNPVKQFDKTITLGFPSGDPLTVYEGRFQYGEKVCIQYADPPFESDVRCVQSNVHNTKAWSGNSGSAMFNKYGEVIGVLYAGSRKDSISVKLSQLKLALDTARALERKERYGKNR